MKKLRCFSIMFVCLSLMAMGLVLASCSEPIADSDEDITPIYTVNFEAGGGTPAPEPQSIARGGKIIEPAPMTKTGQGFGGWFKEAELVSQWNFAADTVTGDITLYAKWDTSFFTVTFNADGGTPAPVPQNIAHNSKVTEPAAMTRTGYIFGGWFKETAHTNQWNFANDTVTGDITIYAKWTLNRYTVTFNANGGTPAPAQQNIDHGGKVTQPAAVTKINYTFGGWYKEAAFTNQWNFANDTVTGDITIYAKWTLNQYTVTFNADGGTPAPAQQTIDHGGKVTQPSAMTKTGYTFGGWFKETAHTNQWNFANDTVTANITLYAKWMLNPYTVTFNADGGTPAPAQQTIDHGGKVTQPSAMTRTGYTFGGWYKEAAFTNQWNFASDVVTSDTAIYAKWMLNQYTVTFNADGGTPVPAQQNIGYGGKVTQPSAMTKTNYTFIGWFKEASHTNQWNFATDVVTANITLYAKWNYNLIIPLTDVNFVVPYLNMQTGGTSADNPISLPVQIDLGNLTRDNSGWQQLLNVIAEADKYVNLDLSVCTMNGTEFNPAYSMPTGKDRIVGIVLPDTAVSIRLNDSGYANFYSALKSFNGAGLTSIGNSAFDRCTNLAMTSLPAGLTSIGDRAFFGTSLALASLPAGITSIGFSAFYGCTGLALTSLPEGITSIGNAAFYGCTSLALTSLPEGITSIGSNAFYGCTSLALTSLPEGITSIGSYAFRDCTSLALTSLPAGITSIGDYAFYGCTSLALTSLPAGLTSIGNSTFYFCRNLALTSLPAGLTSIGISAFTACRSLTQIELPAGITSIGNLVFSGCSQLVLVICHMATPPTLGLSVFGSNESSNNNPNLQIKVPAASVAAYQTATNWSSYADKISAIQ